MILSKWALSMLGLHVHHIHKAVDLRRVTEAADRQAATSEAVIKDAFDRMEGEQGDRRPREIADTIDQNRNIIIATLDRLK